MSEAPPKNLIITNARFSNIDLRFHMLHTPIYEYNCVICVRLTLSRTYVIAINSLKFTPVVTAKYACD